MTQIQRRPPPFRRPAIFDDPGRLTQARLLRRGWTLEQVRRLLGEPDERHENPIDPQGPAIKLYAVARVEQAERSPAFTAPTEPTPEAWRPRPAAGHMVEVQRREAEQTRARARALLLAGDFQVPVLARGELERLAAGEHDRLRRHAEQHPQSLRGALRRRELTPGARKTLRRACVNYLRHRALPYDHALRAQSGDVRTERADQDTRMQVLRLALGVIAAAYPWLRGACVSRLEWSAGQCGAEPGTLPGEDDLPAALRAQLAAGRARGVLDPRA